MYSCKWWFQNASQLTMPLNTIVVNQGDFQTNVPEGNTVQEILPSWGVRTENENLRVIVDKQEPPCQTQPEVQVTELKPESCPDSEFLKCTSEIIPTKSTTIADTTGKASSDRCSRAVIFDSSSTQVPSISPGRSSSSDRSMDEQDMTTFSSVPVSMEVKQGVTTLSSSTTLTNDVSHGCDLGGRGLGGFNVASNKGWGIPKGLGLRGGSPGLNSLNNGTSGWGPVPQPTGNAPTGWGAPATQTSSAGNPNSGVIGGNPGQVGSAGPSSSGSIGPNGASSASNSSSSPPGSGGLNNPGQALPSANNNHPGGANQWASTSPNRNTSQNTNGQPNISGSQINNNPSGNATTQGPPGGNPMQNMGNQNMGNNPNANNSMNQASLGQNPTHASGGVGAGNSGVITNAGSSSWAQAAGKSLQASGPSANSSTNNMNNNAGNPNQGNPALGVNAPPTPGSASQPGSTSSSSVTSKQIEQLNSMREALFSHDGWGGQNVNQDSSWDIPSSPEPPHKDLGMGPAGAAAAGGGTATWKLNVNNGTDLWEANLRNGGAPPPAPATSKTPWGHTLPQI
ncbi:Protein Gawky [Orchesella cincta]|uniref:Protein Gawky n=1 Tax=Orchesella cincta TaxID=48709 RepID=A0A1D2NH86_ORCCI|nr:Protein Gawky [Orchesella cincta]